MPSSSSSLFFTAVSQQQLAPRLTVDVDVDDIGAPCTHAVGGLAGVGARGIEGGGVGEEHAAGVLRFKPRPVEPAVRARRVAVR